MDLVQGFDAVLGLRLEEADRHGENPLAWELAAHCDELGRDDDAPGVLDPMGAVLALLGLDPCGIQHLLDLAELPAWMNDPSNPGA
ncbi:hypothetical protein IV498_14160, partial [Paenarthrobacter sp. Z7-10]|uniref:hypothetical protein n=1 Tax=Paenarthrobacter sp. Z7-10 TaxID=2787635 RepID=UPI0022A922B5